MKGMTRCSLGRVYWAGPSSSLSLMLGRLESVQGSGEEQEEPERRRRRGERTGREVAAFTLPFLVANTRNGAWPLAAITILHMKQGLYCQHPQINNTQNAHSERFCDVRAIAVGLLKELKVERRAVKMAASHWQCQKRWPCRSLS